MKTDLTFVDWQRSIRNALGKKQWIVVYAHKESEYEVISFYSALIPIEMISEILENASWDLSMGHGFPGFIYYGATNDTKYFRFGKDNGIEPLVFLRDFHGIKKPYKEILEEFRHFFNLYHDKKNNKYIRIDENGDEDNVVMLYKDKIEIKLRYIKEFLSIKKMCLAIYFDLLRYSSGSLEELGMKGSTELIKGENYIYQLCISDGYTPNENNKKKSISTLIGKKLIEGLKDYEPKCWDNEEEKGYLDFVIGVNEEGKEIYHTCNPNKLANYFGANPGAPHYLTPIFFRKEVLAKYYANPEKYSVEDNYLKCGGLWGLRLDNNHSKYVIVYLGDLGSDLTTKEQLYWKSFNILPQGNISLTTFRRDFLAEFAGPERNDLLFKYGFESFQGKWYKRFGWHLFKPLKEDDEHYYKSLRIPLTNDQAEFDQQVLALGKILVDSLNDNELKKTVKFEEGGGSIAKFGKFLGSYKLVDYGRHIGFLRNLQSLRSTGVAHRKGRNYQRISKAFHIEDMDLIDVFNEILENSILLLDYLEDEFLN